MATRKVKLSELKVSELKKELEERDLDTSGVKILLQQRLRQALIEVGEDPDVSYSKLRKELLILLKC